MTLHELQCNIQVLYESETFEIMDNNTLYETLSSNLEELVIGSLSPEELKCSGDKMVVNTSTIKSCQSTLDSRYLYVIVESSSSCLDDPSLYQNISWKATVNLITKEMDFEDLCGLR